MDNNRPQVQAMRPVNKDNLDSPTKTPGPTIYFDCHSNPATGKSFVLWDDIRLVFADALYVRHEAKVVPFMKDAEWMTLKPLRIAAVPHAVLDIVVDSPLVRLEAAMRQTTLADTPKEATVHGAPQEDTTSKHATFPVSNTPRRNPVHDLEEETMQNYSHIDHPDFRPKPRVLRFSPTAKQKEDAYEATPNAPNINRQPVNGNALSTNNWPASNAQSHQSPQDCTATAAVRDISPIVVKASLGDPVSQVELGDMYRVGDGVEQDFEASRYWYIKAANQGNPSGQCNLGHLYRLELGVDRNYSTALSWYKKAAIQGSAGGQCYVGLVHEYGLVGTVDYSAAMNWYLMAANQGYAYAQCCIGSLYFMGQGVQQDYDKAMEWYIRAASQGLPAAQIGIGHMYLGGKGVSQDNTIALDWFSKAASRKDVDVWSQISMGLMYNRGLGVPKSDNTAFAWFLKAALQGLPTAQCIVGRMYRDGEGVLQDFSKALSWLTKSSNHNYSYSQHDIGTMYLQGQGVPKDYSKAKEWYTKSANLGDESARAMLSEVQRLIDEDEETAKVTQKKKKRKSSSSRLKFW